MRIDKALSIADLRALARRRLPRIIFDYIDGGVEDEDCVERNVTAFRDQRLLPRYLVDVASPDQTTEVFGRRYSTALGIAPTGMAAVARHRADLILAEAAAAADIPFIISGAATASIEDIAALAPNHAWLQIYGARDTAITRDQIERGAKAGIETLVMTVDVPVNAKRESNIRNGWVRPYRPSVSAFLETLTHPGWVAEYLRHGLPFFENWRTYTEAGASPRQVAAFLSSQMPSTQTWRELETWRRLWSGNLVVKGIMHPEDALRAARAGVDGIIVSNHGGRQLDRSPASLDMLPGIRNAVGDRLTVMLDSGVRRGADIISARALGAKMVFVGRATLYGVAAGGREGAQRAIRILRDETGLVMAQIGCPRLAEIGPEYLSNTGG